MFVRRASADFRTNDARRCIMPRVPPTLMPNIGIYLCVITYAKGLTHVDRNIKVIWRAVFDRTEKAAGHVLCVIIYAYIFEKRAHAKALSENLGASQLASAASQRVCHPSAVFIIHVLCWSVCPLPFIEHVCKQSRGGMSPTNTKIT